MSEVLPRVVVDKALQLYVKFCQNKLAFQSLPTSSKVASVVGIAGAVGSLCYYYYSTKDAQKRSSRAGATQSRLLQSQGTTLVKSGPGREKKIAINKAFWRGLWRLLKIVIPGFRSYETLLLVSFTFFLLLRTAASLAVASLDGYIVKALVKGQGKKFLYWLGLWLVASVPISFINSLIHFFQNKITIAFRDRLTKHVHDEYMSELVYYKIQNLDARIQNADQCIAVDVMKFSHSLANLYSNLAKPMVDLVLYNARLAYNVGLTGLVVMTMLIHTGTFFLRKYTPAFGRLAAEEQRLEGEFRFAHSRLINNAEEIAFYGGSLIEKVILLSKFSELKRHFNLISQKKLYYNALENFIVKYYWGAIGFLICALPVFTPFGRPSGVSSNSLSGRTGDFVTNRRMLLSISDAFGRVMKSYKEINELAGYTARVIQLLDVFTDIQNGKFEKSNDISKELARTNDPNHIENVFDDSKGAVIYDEKKIEVQKLWIVSPNGDILVKDLSFSVPHGKHLLIVGPNGCGKSSLFRIMGELWPVFRGLVMKPKGNLFYIPQRPYLSLGSLRDQVTYPDSLAQVRAKNITDANLAKILELVKLNYLQEREGWDSVKDWKELLSGGEKQRIAFARLFYHAPKYAILDECTSAVSIDVEGMMYTSAKENNISLITVSHRPSLWKYHDLILEFDGSGGWRFGDINQFLKSHENSASVGKLTLEEEQTQLKKRIQEDSARLKKVCDLLGHEDRNHSDPSLHP